MSTPFQNDISLYDNIALGGFGGDDLEQGSSINEYSKRVYYEDPKTLIEVEPGYELHRRLDARHMSMIAIGATLGTGLVIGSGPALAMAGPASILLAYAIVGGMGYFVMAALSEMATWIPLPEGLAGYTSRFVDPALGFALGWTYFFKYAVVTPNQLTAGAMIIQLWVSSDRINPGVWITVLLVAIVAFNLFAVRWFGEVAYYTSALKMIAIVGMCIVMIVIAVGGAPNHDASGFRYWKNPGAFVNYLNSDGEITGTKGRFISWASVLVQAIYSFSSMELVGVTVGEAQNPRKNIPRAFKTTFWRILLLYLLALFVLGLALSSRDEQLMYSTNNNVIPAFASPFVIAVLNSGISKLADVINGALLIFVISAAINDLYIGTRTLYGLSLTGKAPRFLARTNKFGVPYISLTVMSMFCLLAYMNVKSGSAKVFGYLVNVATIFGLLTWLTILYTHMRFMKALAAQSVNRDLDLVYKAPFQPYGTYIAFGFFSLLAVFKNFGAFVFEFDVATFVTGYIGIPVFVILWLGFKLVRGTTMHSSTDTDLFTLKDIIDKKEKIFIEVRERELETTHVHWYERAYEKFFRYFL